MSKTSSILKLNKMALLMGTCLVAAGCAGTTDMQSDSSSGTPVAQKTEETAAVSKQGMTQSTLMRIGARAWKKGNASTALRLYGMASQKNPKDPAPLLAMAEILRKTKKPGAAIELYKRILETAPDTPEAHNGIGYAFLKQDKPYMAAQSFETAIALAPKDPKALGGMGVALDTAGEHSKAQDFYRLAIKEAPKNLTYQNNLALSLALSGRTEQAIAMLEIITAHPKATARHRQNLALVYGMAGKSAEAMRYSRMDLNERDARNNALYFQALTNNSSKDLAEKQDQADLMATRENARFRDPSTARQPYAPLNASEEDTELSIEPRAEERVEEKPVFVDPSERQASRQVDIQDSIAKAPSTAEQLVKRKSDAEEQGYAPISAAPIPEVEKELLMQPAQFKPAEEMQKQDQISEETTSFAQSRPHHSSVPRDYSQMMSRKRSVALRPASQNLQYFAQLGSFRTKERALAGWQVLMERHFDLLSEQPLVISKVELGQDKGIFYRIRVGAFNERDVPDQLCKMLISRAQGCYTPQVATTSIRFTPKAVEETPRVADQPEVPADPDRVTATNISYSPLYRPKLKKYDASLIAF